MTPALVDAGHDVLAIDIHNPPSNPIREFKLVDLTSYEDTRALNAQRRRYSSSKLVQEMQADSLTRRHEDLSVVSSRLHAVLEDATQAQRYIDILGNPWAVNGLFGYCTFKSVADAIERPCVTPIDRHEELWVVDPEIFATSDSRDLAQRFYPSVNITSPLIGRAAFFDASRTHEILNWTPSTVAEPTTRLVDI